MPDPSGESLVHRVRIDDLEMPDELRHGNHDALTISRKHCPTASDDGDVGFPGHRRAYVEPVHLCFLH